MREPSTAKGRLKTSSLTGSSQSETTRSDHWSESLRLLNSCPKMSDNILVLEGGGHPNLDNSFPLPHLSSTFQQNCSREMSKAPTASTAGRPSDHNIRAASSRYEFRRFSHRELGQQSQGDERTHDSPAPHVDDDSLVVETNQRIAELVARPKVKKTLMIAPTSGMIESWRPRRANLILDRQPCARTRSCPPPPLKRTPSSVHVKAPRLG